MSDVTQILGQIEAGAPSAAEELLPLVYDELRRLAHARMSHEPKDLTLEATALVHEAYLRLVGPRNGWSWQSRRHFFATAAEAMRRILIDRARHRRSLKNGGDRQRLELEAVAPGEEETGFDLLELNDALDALKACDFRAAEVVKLRYFAGLTIPEVAELLGISVGTAKNDWDYARCWLRAELSGGRQGT
jgi:RNA polymerase sigma factor (TIGR02999 family)